MASIIYYTIQFSDAADAGRDSANALIGIDDLVQKINSETFDSTPASVKARNDLLNEVRSTYATVIRNSR